MSTIRLFGYDAPSMNAFAPEAEGDDALFARYRARRDDDALAALLGRHWTRAFSLAQRIVRDPALAEDAAQEAFVKLARATGGYDERGRFAAFLTAIVVNEARNALRAKRRRGGHEETAGRARGGAPGGGRSDGGGGAGGSGGWRTAGAPAAARAPGRGLGETDGAAAAPDVAARGGAGDPAAARPEERAASGPPPAGPARAPEAPAPAPAPPAGPLPAREALARAVARLGEVPLVALDLRTERGGDRLSATVTARPATGEFRVESRGGYPLDFGYDGVFWWISWVGANEVLRRAPKAGSPHDYVRLAREEALGLTLEMLPVFEAVAYAGPALRAGESPSVVDFRVASAEGAATIDPADGRLRAFELRTPAGGGPLFLAGRYAYPGEGDVPAGAFRDLPAGEDAAWRVAEDDESRAVIVRIERDRLGRVEVQGFIEGAPSLLAGASAAEARGRDDRGVAYRGLAPRLHDSQTENDLARDLRDSVVPMAARWSIELAPEGAAARTRVTVVQTGTVERGTAHVPFFRFILHVLGGARKGPEAYLAFLAKDLGPAPADAPGLTGSAAAPPPPTSRSPPA